MTNRKIWTGIVILSTWGLMSGAVSTVPAAGPPKVFWVSDPIGPHETALLFGDDIGPKVATDGWLLPDAPVSPPPANPAAFTPDKGRPLEVLQASDLCAKVLLPTDWKPGLFAVRLKNDAGISEPSFLNRTEPWWWLGGENDTAFVGEELRVFGKNFGEKSRAWLIGGGPPVPLPVVKAEKYTARYQVPSDLAPGEYALWLHNGFGGQAGFGGPLNVKVAKRQPWPATPWSVKDFGAKGDGEADDTTAFQAALAAAAKNGGGVVFVPRGTYKITDKLVVPPRTLLRGEKREWVWLYVPVQTPEFDAVIAGNGDFAVEDLSIVAQTTRRLIACPDHTALYRRPWGSSPPPDQLGRNARLRRLRLHHLRYAHRVGTADRDPRRLETTGPSAVVLVGPDMELSDSEVVSSGVPLALWNARHARVERNRLDTGRSGWYYLANVEETVFEGNTIQARDLEGSYGGVQGKAYRLYIAGNHWRDAFGCEREALTFDTPYACTWMGRVRDVRGRTLTTADKKWTPGQIEGQVCLIVYGKGMGQYLPIVSNTETTLTLNRPWAVPPDESSHVAVRLNKSDVVIAGNTFADASAAVQLYAQCCRFLIDGNRAERTGGSYGIGWDYQRTKTLRAYSTCWFNQWLNNDFSQGFIYQQGAFLKGILGPCASASMLEPPAVNTLGNVVRNNTLRDNHTAGAFSFGPHPLQAPKSITGCLGRDTLVEGNAVSDSPLALEVYPLYVDTLLRSNRVERCAVPLRDDGTNTWIHPAERLSYQVQAVKALLGAGADLDAAEKAAADLAALPANAPELPARCDQLRAQLWKEVGRRQPQGTSPEAMAVLGGLRWEVDSGSPLLGLLASGKGGPAELRVRVHLEPWAAEISVQTAVTAPAGWLARGSSAAVPLKPGQTQLLSWPVQVPAGADARFLPVRLIASLDGVCLSTSHRLDVSRREVRQWMILGPLTNTSGKLPDPIRHPAEVRFDLNAQYDGLGGRIGWKSVALADKYVRLDRLLKPGQSATALAVASLHAEEETEALLTLGWQGSLDVRLNDAALASLSAPGGSRTLRVSLRKGDNILLCKSSFLSGGWSFSAEIAETGPGQRIRLRVAPANVTAR